MMHWINYAVAGMALFMAYVTLDAKRWGRGRYVAGAIFLILTVVAAFSGKASASDAIIGDSIACGTGAHLHAAHFCRSGAGSCEIAGWAGHIGRRDRVVISAGINDSGACVALLRSRINAREVVWVLPASINGGRAAVLAAMRPGDKSVSYRCSGICNKRNFHPGSYPTVARAIQRVW